MKIKHYRAADMRQALRLVRDAQGPDAVILSSRRTNGGVEIVAAVDYDTEAGVDTYGREHAGAGARDRRPQRCARHLSRSSARHLPLPLRSRS